MKRVELYSLQNGIANCGNLFNKDTVDFIYRIGFISEEIDKRIRLFEKSRPKTSEEYIKYTEAQQELIEECAIKDDKGAMVTRAMGIAIANPTKYKEQLKELQEKFKDAINKHKAANKTFEKFLEEEATDFVFAPIPKKHIPTAMTLDQFKGILPIIEPPK